ncbi:hypothetical protein [uncultured Sphingomonas sp.]|uniref:hypothetical protein n=1 Tax=uncultured Sphingomonas sp. TaxID=158754 RepID=UPI0025D43F7F|nr:hypothetical protein [uncultured Sphingomonas sp.]
MTVSVGTRLGCICGALTGAAICLPAFIAMAWGGAHCDPAPPCQVAAERHFGGIVLSAIMAAVPCGCALRWMVNRWVAARQAAVDGWSAALMVIAAGLFTLAAIRGAYCLLHIFSS